MTKFIELSEKYQEAFLKLMEIDNISLVQLRREFDELNSEQGCMNWNPILLKIFWYELIEKKNPVYSDDGIYKMLADDVRIASEILEKFPNEQLSSELYGYKYYSTAGFKLNQFQTELEKHNFMNSF